MDESDRLVLPAHRERRHADAHRRRQHLRRAAAAVRGSARDGRRQARARPALPPEGALRAARRRTAGVGRRSALQPRLPPAPHRGPAPGGEEQLRAMAARVFSQHLDRDKPLWELWAVEGLQGERWALLSKVHHCMVDGVAATDLMSVMFSDTTAAAPARGVVAGPRAVRASRSSCARSRRRASPAGQLDALRRALRRPGDAALGRASSARATAAAATQHAPRGRLLADRADRPAPPLELGRRAPADVKSIRAELGGTVNDVVLTLITDGFRELLDGARRACAGRITWCARWCPCRCAGAASAASTTTASQRCSPACPWASMDPPGACARSARRWTASRSPSRRSPATCSPRCPASRRRCCWRSAAAW